MFHLVTAPSMSIAVSVGTFRRLSVKDSWLFWRVVVLKVRNDICRLEALETQRNSSSSSNSS
ncbi:hypothetical protein E2C01_027805 [Portunus trituberculatus]|uniref:Uncharacterized protein n=1 Tax=Portunus trituberculatus TaxID=210409 RepID=A0A5B7EM64_PORTR|nr:hypothetical protein [Portunus trituberculatus]